MTRHAPQAARVTVAVEQDGDTVRVAVCDDAAPPQRPGRAWTGGFGLIGMRERVEALGGRLRFGPAEPRGWTVVAELPR